MKDNAELFRTLDGLVAAASRDPARLSVDLAAHGRWGALLTTLQDVRAFAGNELTDVERRAVHECIRVVDQAVHRS